VSPDGRRAGEKNHVPKNLRHAETAILEAAMGPVPELRGIQPGVRLDAPAVRGIVDGDELKITCKKSGKRSLTRAGDRLEQICMTELPT
jgi:hypothetical protein